MDRKLTLHDPARRATLRRARAAPPHAGAVRERDRVTGLRREMCTRRWRDAVFERESRLRQRMACRLHDELGQLLVLQGLKLGELGQLVGPDATVVVRELQVLLDRTAEAVSAAVLDLAEPVEPPSLLAALQDVAAQVTGYGQLTVTVQDKLPRLAIAQGLVTAIRRIVQELCLNVQKHAQARQVRICASIEGAQLCISVADDGAGLTCRAEDLKPARRGGFGLASAQAQLRALGGRLQLRSEPGRGTCVSLLLPRPAAG